MHTLDEVIKDKINGLYYGNRILLPFKAVLLKVIIESDIITDFSKSSKGVHVVQHQEFMELYFLEYKRLSEALSAYEAVKIVLVEEGKDVFDWKNHRKIALYLAEKHKVTIEETDADILFIE